MPNFPRLSSWSGRGRKGRSARAVMLVGTSSHCGKSWTATALCRWLRRRGVSVAPFKAQNMSLNAAVCPGGGEIGRSQAVQAEACGLEPTPEMNPVLLKPSGEDACQAVVDGRVWKTLKTGDYPQAFPYLAERVEAAYRRLAERYEAIVVEGAGAAVELNLRSWDLANLGLAARFDIPALLVADIDRGGVFASVVGTMALLRPAEARLLRGFVVNRFRGDASLFDSGRRLLEQRADRPCLGVFPYQADIRLDAEDSLSLDSRGGSAQPLEELKIVVVRLPHISNFTDFQLLPGADYVVEPTPYDPDVIILPGTKNTLGDLAWLKRTGLDRWILDKRKDGAAVWGVCGGYQMLGRFVADPDGVESEIAKLPGLGLLPHQTTLRREKTTRRVRARLELNGLEFEAYEIHMGESTPSAQESPFCRIDSRPEGCLRRGILGTYLHGAFENAAVLQALLDDAARWRKKRPARVEPIDREAEFDKLADWFDRHVERRRFEDLYL